MSRGHASVAFILPALVVLVTALSYLPSLDNGFTNWDDDFYILENSDVQDLSWRSVSLFFAAPTHSNYHPLTLFTYATVHRFFKLDPRAYHALNLLLHLANCLLVYAVLLLLTGRAAAAATGAFLFGVHPMHVESVAWASELKDVLSTFFFLGALAAYLLYRPPRGKKYYWLSLALLLLSLLSKAMAITFPLVLLLVDRFLGRKTDRRSLGEKIPFFLLAAAFAALALAAQYTAFRKGSEFPFYENVLIASYGLIFYLVKLLAPLRLSAIYPYPQKIDGLLPLPFLLAPLAVILLAAIFFVTLRRSRAAVFGLLFFLVTILPVLQLVPVGSTVAADRYTYIPSLGLFFLAGVGLDRLLTSGARGARLLVTLGAAAVILSFSCLTWQRTQVWANGLTLWDDVIANYPRLSPVAYVNRGNWFSDRGLYDRAIGDYNTALELRPGYDLALYNRGYAHGLKGDHLKAVADLSHSLNAEPDNADAHFYRGYSFWILGDRRKAVEDYRRMLNNSPEVPVKLSGSDLAREAMIQFAVERARRNDKSMELFHQGNNYLAIGEVDRAVEFYRRALAISPDSESIHTRLGSGLERQGKLEEAMEHWRRALAINPDYGDAHLDLGVALAEQGKLDEAIGHYREAIRINPSDLEARYNLGVDLLALGRATEAREEFREVLRLKPDHHLAKQRLEELARKGL